MTLRARLITIGAVFSLLFVPAAAAESGARASSSQRGVVAFVSDRDSTATVINDDIYLLHPASKRVDRVTTDEAVDWWPALSPDGRSLAWLKIPVVAPNNPVIADAALYV